MSESNIMSEAMFYVLLALNKQSHGYNLMERVSHISGGRISVGPGTLYGILTRMNKDGLIALNKEDDRRKYYSMTDKGRVALKKEKLRLETMLNDAVREENNEI